MAVLRKKLTKAELNDKKQEKILKKLEDKKIKKRKSRVQFLFYILTYIRQKKAANVNLQPF